MDLPCPVGLTSTTSPTGHHSSPAIFYGSLAMCRETVMHVYLIGLYRVQRSNKNLFKLCACPQRGQQFNHTNVVISHVCLFTHRRRNTSLVPTTYRMDRRATTFNAQMWLKSAWPTAMRPCAMSSVFL